MPRALIAFDKFKNSLRASEACRIAGSVFRAAGWEVEECPLTDGGEGFAEILTSAAGGEWRKVDVVGARGARIPAGFGLIEIDALPGSAIQRLEREVGSGSVAIVEMPLASGLAQLAASERDPWFATSFGTGELVAVAAEAGAKCIVLGVGGSATNDLGIGALAALGICPVDSSGESSGLPIPKIWGHIAGFRGGPPRDFPAVRIACDVANPLLGPRGCSATYGPQKGLRPEDVPAMESAAARMAQLLCRHFGKSEDLARVPGGGAAGGIAFGFLCAFDARLVSGADLVSDWLDLGSKLRLADIVVTGEGRFDSTSLEGKGPGALLREASARGIPAIVLPGSAESGLRVWPGVEVRPITPPGLPLEEALGRAGEFLERAASGFLSQ